LRLDLRDRRLLGLHVRLERALFESVKQVALLDLAPLGKQALVKERRHARRQIDATDGQNAAEELAGFGDGLAFDLHDANCGRRRLLG